MVNMKKMFLRMFIYLTGIFSVSAGIVLCVRCEMGISPISSIPYVIHFITPLSFGMLTMIFHLVNSMVQYILEKKLINVRIFMQVPVAVLFGFIIDLMEMLINFEAESAFLRWVSLILSVVLTAFGMLLMINMKLVQNPPDGTVRLVSNMIKRDMGAVKIAYDVLCVMISLAIGIVFMGKLTGFGIATVVSAIFVGRTLSMLEKYIGKYVRMAVEE